MLDIVHLGQGHTDHGGEVLALGLKTLGQGLFGQFPSHQRSLALAQQICQDQTEGSLLLSNRYGLGNHPGGRLPLLLALFVDGRLGSGGLALGPGQKDARLACGALEDSPDQ